MDQETDLATVRQAREIARAEVASLCGLVLRRLQDEGPTRSFERNATVDILESLFGEALHDFGGTHDEPGTE
jgi:hypothetical protein